MREGGQGSTELGHPDVVTSAIEIVCPICRNANYNQEQGERCSHCQEADQYPGEECLPNQSSLLVYDDTDENVDVKFEPIHGDDNNFLSEGEQSMSSSTLANLSVNEDTETRPLFPCSICKKEFHKKGHMTRHLLTHNPEQPYPCDFCSRRFSSKYSLQQHLIKRHNANKKPFSCKSCTQSFTLLEELKTHSQLHSIKTNYCIDCKKKFRTKLGFDKHLQVVHSEAPQNWFCPFCPKFFPRKFSLERHQKTHKPGGENYCTVCNKIITTGIGIKYHLREVHERKLESKPFSCNQCVRKFAVQQSLEIHLEFHKNAENKPFACERCDVRFKTKERLEQHLRVHGTDGGFHCSYCVRSFARKFNLTRHELSHTEGRRKPKNGPPIPIIREKEKTKPKNPFPAQLICSFFGCPRTFKSIKGLRFHTEREHNGLLDQDANAEMEQNTMDNCQTHDQHPMQCLICPNACVCEVAVKIEVQEPENEGEEDV